MNNDFEIYPGKTLSDVTREVYHRSEAKKLQLDSLIIDMRGHVKDKNDALNFLPRLKELLEVGIKNDEQLIKLMAVHQKIKTAEIETEGGAGGAFILTEEEKEQLLKNTKIEMDSIVKEVSENPTLKK